MNKRNVLHALAKYVPAILALLGGIAAIIGEMKNLHGVFGVPSRDAPMLKQTGAVVFVGSLAWTVGLGGSRLSELAELYKKFERQMREFSEREHYGNTIQELQRLSKNRERHGTVEAVGGTALRIAQKVSSTLVPNIKSYCGDGAYLAVDENYVISDILEAMSKSPDALPEGAIWLGISKLGASWKERANMDLAFQAFDRNLCELESAKKIHVIRIYCAPRRDEGLVIEEARTYKSRGMDIRFLVEDEIDYEVPDISIVLRRRRFGGVRKVPEALDALLECEPLYGLRFDVENRIMIQRMTFIKPDDPAFSGLVTKMRTAWNDAKSISA